MRPYTVKIPPQWTGINSARAQAYLRDYFIHPLTLPADPGPGEHAVCLTLNERLVGKLAEGTGEKPAVALRRLLAARIRELPAVSSPAPESRLIARARREVREPKVVVGSHPWEVSGGVAIPSCYTGGEAAWLRESEESKQVLWQMERMMARPQVKPSPVKMSLVEILVERLRALWPWVVLLAVIIILLARSSGAQHSSAAAAQSRYPAWRPE